jgi:hypothetical protein
MQNPLVIDEGSYILL